MRTTTFAVCSVLVALATSACSSTANLPSAPKPVLPSALPASSQATSQNPPTPLVATSATIILPNEEYGYRLRYPADYTVVLLNDRSLCFTPSDAAGGCEVASARLDVRDADGHTLADVADELAAGANPSIPVTRISTKIGDADAMLLDDIYAYDVLRQLVILHGNRFYVFTFPAWQEGSEGFLRLQTLYSSLTGSLTFFDQP